MSPCCNPTHSPYLLPCLVTSFASLVATLTTAFTMDETLKKPDTAAASPADEEQGEAAPGPALQRVNSRSIGPYLSRMGSMMLLPRVGSLKRIGRDSRSSGGSNEGAEVGMVAMKGRQASTGSSTSDDNIGLLEEGEEVVDFKEQRSPSEASPDETGGPAVNGDGTVEINLVETEEDAVREEVRIPAAVRVRW